MSTTSRPTRRKTRHSGAFYGTFCLVVLLFAVTVYSQIDVQVFGRGKILAHARSAWLSGRDTEVPPERGTIYSSDGRILAQSRPQYDFWVFYDRVPCTPGFFMSLAQAAGVPEARISAPYLAGKKRVWLNPLDAAHYALVSRVKSQWDAGGVSLEQQTDRDYPMRDTAVGLVGWTHDGKPMSGAELAFDRNLSGKNGSLDKDVVLTVDSQLQNVATIAIRNAVEQNRAKSGAAVVMVPSTGEVLALANWPTFDPAKGPQGGNEMATSYMEDLPPGSTFKPLTLAKALDLGVVDDSFHITCTGSYSLGHGKPIQCDEHHGVRAHGSVNLDRAIAMSCNVAAAQWALAIGRDKMVSYLRQLNLLEKPGIGLPGAATPLFQMDEYDKQRQLATLGFGQSIAVPPVSLAAALCMIANDGEYVPPRVVTKVNGQRVPPTQPLRVVSPEAARQVRGYMESVLDKPYGTGKTLALQGYEIAGKTGTAQFLGPDGGNVSSFVGMLPADHPKVLILVMVDRPDAGEIYGSLVAGPAFDQIAVAAINKLGIANTPSKEG